MNRRFSAVLALCCLLVPLRVWSKGLSDAEIKKAIIAESIEDYKTRLHKNCPCPENLDKRGSLCGKRSAYIRAGGESPICEDSDITPDLIRRWKTTHSTL